VVGGRRLVTGKILKLITGHRAATIIIIIRLLKEKKL
jgi:hypothetical protein